MLLTHPHTMEAIMIRGLSNAVCFTLLALIPVLLIGQNCLAQTDLCDPDPCQGMPNAVAGTCTAVGGACTPATDFFCSCDSGYTWQDTSNTCESLPTACDGVVDFPDPNLEQAIRDAIGKPTGDIYGDDLLGLTSLVSPLGGHLRPQWAGVLHSP